MMKNKIRITRKDLAYTTTIKVPYCGLQCLLASLDADYYNAGVYGWNYDVYLYDDWGGDIDGIARRYAIVTGYRPCACDYEPSYELIKKTDDNAEHIKRDNGGCMDWILRNDLIRGFIKETLREARQGL